MRHSILVLASFFSINGFAQGTWTQLDDHPGGQRYAQAAFNIGGKGYVCTGFNGSSNTDALWEYDAVTGVLSVRYSSDAGELETSSC